MLTRAGVESADRARLLPAFRRVSDPERLRVGVRVRVARRSAAHAPHRVEVDLDRDRTVLLERSGGAWTAALGAVPTTADTLFATGEIQESLWRSVTGNAGLVHLPERDRVVVVAGMDRVFQWQVDFSRQIREGDAYRFLFERETRPDGTMRSGELLAARLVAAGRELWAVRFDPNGDGRGAWYDLEGESVRRAFLKKPLELSRISSGFANRRFHPILKRWRAHRGVDYAADAGAPVEVTGDGVVSRRGWNDSYGWVVDVRHPNGFLTRYAHLRGFAAGVAVGARVVQGQVVGYVGMTGLATGPHLHYEMHRGGRPIDPLAVDLPADEPLPAEQRERWERERDALLERLLGRPAVETLVARRAAAEEADSG